MRSLVFVVFTAFALAVAAFSGGAFERLPADDNSCCGPVDECDWCDVGASGGTGGTR